MPVPIAFGLLELIILLAILALLAILFGPVIADSMMKAKKATAGRTPLPTWLATPTSIPVDTATAFNFSLTFQGPAGTLPAPGPANSPVFFDLVVIRGSGQIVSVTANGNDFPQAKTATPGSPAADTAGSTDVGGLITVIVKLEENSQAQLIAHDAPATVKASWTVPSSTFSAP